MRARALALAGAIAWGTVAWAPPALAVMDPTHAQADVDAATRAHAYTFCRAPHEPLSPDARELCPHATDIPDCAGFAAVCAKVTTTTPSWSFPKWWGMFSLPPFLGVLFQVLVWLVVAALVLAILVPVVMAIARFRRRDDARRKTQAPAAAAVEPLAEIAATGDEEALLARADELLNRGEYGAALQLYLAAGLRALDKRGAVRIARDRTNGEYVRSCADPGAKPALRDIVREVDRVQFGGEPATRDAASRAAQRAIGIVRAVRAVPVALLAMVLPLVLGCAGSSVFKPRVPGDDPAGGELLRDVLRAQGVTVKGLESSLATMPLPSSGERVPAVVVDVKQTSLDDDTRAHLASWVDAGGVLVLAGSPTQWPKEFGASYASATSSHKIIARRLLARAVEPAPGEDDDEDSESAIYARTEEHAVVATDGGLKISGASESIAWFDDHTTYAAVVAYGKGRVLCIATDELLTNAGIARRGNAAALVAILAATSRSEMHLADPEDGVSPPSTPISALLRAGLGSGLLHAVPFVLVLFLGAGVRLSRPKALVPPRRRAFAEHVAAVGALYARTHNAAHGLAAYARFADERLRARMPRGSTDVGGFLASRAGMPLDVCHRLWARAMQAKSGAPPLGDELAVLRELSMVYAAAMQQER